MKNYIQETTLTQESKTVAQLVIPKHLHLFCNRLTFKIKSFKIINIL